MLTAFAVLILGQDLPDGNFRRLENSGDQIAAGDFWRISQLIPSVFVENRGHIGKDEKSVKLQVADKTWPVALGRGLEVGTTLYFTNYSRSLGLISGMTGGGGNVRAVITQLAFFKGSRYSKQCCTLPLCLINFSQWGGMFSADRSSSSSSLSVTEEDYYIWSSQEKERGLHQASLKFAENSRRERGRRSACNTAPTNDTSSSSSAEFVV
ncbi:unnamed protein product [Linum tenue]|uniref:Uncharacterized protein n=1 Tax=Linum tenue TaxID=586396 RepID=A0AAV0L719_9ROSI|nr:unnamed protein product [Linum tenue]